MAMTIVNQPVLNQEWDFCLSKRKSTKEVQISAVIFFGGNVSRKTGTLTCLSLSLCGIGCQICASCRLRWWNRTVCCTPWPSGSAWTDFHWPLSQSCWGVPRRWWRGFQLRGGGTRAFSAPPWRRWSGLWPSSWCGFPRRPQTPELGRRSCGSRTLCGRSLLPLLCPERGWSWSPVHSGGNAETYSWKRRRPTEINWRLSLCYCLWTQEA